MTAPFLTIVTRTHHRPWGLARCRASVQSLVDGDYEHWMLDDPIGVGIRGSHQMVIDASRHFQGRYIWLLDDDDYLIEPALIDHLKAATEDDPPVVFVRCQHSTLGKLPPDKRWEKPPQLGALGFPCLVVRADVWREHCDAMTTTETGGDFALADRLWGRGVPFRWLDVTAVHIPQKGSGVPEERYKQCLGTLKRINKLWAPRKQRVLYIGASSLFPPAFVYELRQAGHKMTLLEIWPDNVHYYEHGGASSFEHVIHGNVLELNDLELPHEHYDIAFWWHGPEHVERGQVELTLEGLEQIADLVVAACPFGKSAQVDYPNPYQDHLSALYPVDFEKLGYQVQTLGGENIPGAQLMAWKGDTMPTGKQQADKKTTKSHIYDGHYVKLEGPGQYQYWRVENGERFAVRDIPHMHSLGLAPMHKLPWEELHEIPLVDEPE
jgi:hypothetical protein